VTQPDFDHAELLRRMLHAEADTIEPAEDGLRRIRARLTEPHSAPVAWITTGWSELAGRARGGLQTLAEWMQRVPGTARERFRAARSGLQHPVWRPVAGLALAAFIAIAAVFAFTPVPQHVFAQAVALIQTVEGGGPAVGTGGPAVSGGGTQTGGAAPGAAASKKHHNSAAPAHCATPAAASPGPCPSPSACPSAKAGASPMPSASPAASASRSACPAPAPTPSPSPSSTPSPSPSSTPSPAATAPNPADSTAPAPAGGTAPGPADSAGPRPGG
jgi:hypothetical protein